LEKIVRRFNCTLLYRLYDVVYVIILLYSILYWCILQLRKKKINKKKKIFCSKSNCETMYHWFFLLEITVVKIMNNLNFCSTHSYLYPWSRFKQEVNTLFIQVLYSFPPSPLSGPLLHLWYFTISVHLKKIDLIRPT
jgi:hypothetical protein